MSKSKKFLFVLMMMAITPIGIFMMPTTAVAAKAWPTPTIESLGLATATCATGSAQNPELIRLRDAISAAGNLNEARTLALTPTNDAIDALRNARSIMPFSEDLRLAETRLSDARSRIIVASSQEQVADAFDGMMIAGLDDDSAVRASAGGGSCNYSTGEIIAIVVGLILGIIPGLILLVVLC
ncbi:hypothetical protein [Methylomicrobium lacus]|uniref:hypothetical protein n=1 Tax=Methylomicrobium lacus TaxID=136992 RepID=UPI0035A8941A